MVYDIAIVGGGTAGCAAAYIAGKLGLRTVVIEKTDCLGGAMTNGLVIPAMFSANDSVNTDFFSALIEKMRNKNAQITYHNNPGWFNPIILKNALFEMLSEIGVDMYFNATVTDINHINKHIECITIKSEMLSVSIAAKYVVDSTGDAEIFEKLGCEFINKNNELQPVSLRFIADNVDVKTFAQWVMEFDSDRNVTTMHTIDNQVHMSTAYTWDADKHWSLRPLFDDAVTTGVLKDEDRSYFQVFTVPNMPDGIAFNCPRMVYTPEIDPLSRHDTEKAYNDGLLAIERIMNFCRLYLPGFKNAKVAHVAKSLGIRVSRRIKGKYIYTLDDIKSGKRFDNPVLRSDYPIDVHSNKKGKSVLQKLSQPYELPIESLLSADFDNLFAAGRCLSADFYAHAALRIQPSCFSMGEAVAKYVFNKLKY